MVAAFHVVLSGIRLRNGFATVAFKNVLTVVIAAKIVVGSVVLVKLFRYWAGIAFSSRLTASAAI